MHALVRIADRHRRECVAVIGAAKGEHFRSATHALVEPILHGHFQCDFDRDRAAVGEEHAIEIARQQRRKPRCKPHRRLVDQAAKHDMRHGFKLPCDRGADMRMIIAVAGRPPACDPIDKLAPVRKHDARTMRCGNRKRRRILVSALDDFERFVYPGLTFAVPSDPSRYEARLIERFPDEAGAIRRYFRDLRSVARWTILGIQQQMAPAPLACLIAQYRRLGAAEATQTTGAYLARHFSSPLLKSLLASQWGDYGVPPKQSAFAIHALVAGSYFDGAWFPQGGAGQIARTFEQGIETSAGAIKVCQEVMQIVTSGGRAIGVKAIDQSGADPVEVAYHAPVIISNVGAQLTYQRLLPVDGEIGRRTAKARALLNSLVGGLSAVNLYVRLKEPVSTLGVQGENYWINTELDHDDVEAHTAMVLAGEPRHAYLSFPSAKSGDERFHTAEIIAMVQADAFKAWCGTSSGNRGRDYAELKERIAQGLLRLADTAVPGFSALVRYSELSTPLTVEHFTSRLDGCFYGLPATPKKYRSAGFSARTPIDGLYLSGSDVASLGIVGAMMGGAAAASQALGSAGFLRIMAQVNRPPAPSSAAARPAPKKRARLLTKTALTRSIWRLEFELDEPVNFVPGQYVKLRVAHSNGGIIRSRRRREIALSCW